MAQVVKTELWSTITRRGLIGNVTMGIVSAVEHTLTTSRSLIRNRSAQIPMIFYALVNLAAYVVEGAWVLMGRPKWIADAFQSRASTANRSMDQKKAM